MQILKTINLACLLIISQSGFTNNGKISKQLERELNNNESVELYILLKNKYKVQQTSSKDRISHLKNIILQLKANSQASKDKLNSLLPSLTKDYEFYWVNNSLRIKMDSQQARDFILSDSILKAYSNTAQRLKVITEKTQANAIHATGWNINMINAPQVWNQGIKGQNVVIAGQDTGYQWQHESIKNKYAGWNGIIVDHNYHWHDAINNPIIDCLDAQSNPESCDDHGHGTHTMGTMIGDDGQGNQIGVAPDAKWIGCRNMDRGSGTPATYTECFQFFLEPTDLNDSNPDVSKAPHIINNSWGCDFSEGCIQPDALESVVNNVVAAGILVVASAGNSGPGCNSINTPIAIYNKSLTIGSTTSSDTISSFSSQGAITVDGSNRIKPDLVAPGSSVRSADVNGGYVSFSGTSMAAPHVAGVAALMISANPAMAGKPKILKHILLRSSIAKTSQQTCSGILGSQRPNNTYGWGRLDALAAVNQIKDIIFFDNYEDF
ncbi:MAG: S8 family serine peptidase [Alcanivoracaceae bacterium]|nr:S8 family serine peptidase [Alcanivoracaceae bacterium]